MRIEADLIGNLEIPHDALYGINTMRTVNNLTFSGRTLNQYPSLINALVIVKKAAAKANLEAGLISEKISNAICLSCEQIIEGAYHDQFIVDVLHGGGGIGFNMNINEVICNLANEKLDSPRGTYSPIHPVDHVNASQSTSDVCHTAMRMAIIKSFQPLSNKLDSIIAELEKKAREFQPYTTITRTCLQDGVRAQMGEIFSGYVTVMMRRKQNLIHAVKQLYQINLGGTVIGSGVGAQKEYRNVVLEKLCQESNMNFSHRDNLFDAAQNMDDLAQVSSELRLLATCLIKIAKDFRLLSSGPEAGFAEIQLPSVQAGSSFFPGKINPIIPETMIQCCFQVLAFDRAVQAVLEHGELDLNVFECSAGINILDAINMLEKAIALFVENCVSGILVNQERCRELSNGFIPTIVELKEKLGYSTVSKLIKEKSKEEVKQLLHSGGDINDTTY